MTDPYMSGSYDSDVAVLRKWIQNGAAQYWQRHRTGLSVTALARRPSARHDNKLIKL
jgi:hypothetical protein